MRSIGNLLRGHCQLALYAIEQPNIDTVIMIDGSDTSVRNLKLILYCFEWLSGLKINFHKSDVFVLELSELSKRDWPIC